jgi:hypothetical protein
LTHASWAAGSQHARGIMTIALVAILVAFVVAAVARRRRRFFLAQFPLSLLAVGFVCYTVTYHMPPGRTLALLVLLTSREEVSGFLMLPQGTLLLALLVGWGVAYIFLAILIGDAPIFIRPVTLVSRAILLLILPDRVRGARPCAADGQHCAQSDGRQPYICGRQARSG